MDPLSDSTNSIRLPPASGVERWVTYLIVGLGLTLLFLMIVIGIGRVEKASSDVTREVEGNPVETSEIVGSDDTGRLSPAQ